MKFSILVSAIALTLTGIAANAEGQRVLVVMKSPEAFKHADYQFKRRGQATSQSVLGVDAKVESSLSNINSLVLSVKNDSDIVKLQQNSGVALVEKEIFHPLPAPVKKGLMGPSQMTTLGMPDAGTPWGIKAVKAIEAWKNSKAGDGARVLVLDTGLDKDHPAIAPNFEKGRDFTGEGDTPYEFVDHVGHGTHCAGTIAGAANNQTGFTGVAPKAKILAGRVCSEQGCSNVAIAQGLNWAITEKVDLVSMSLGGAMATPAERMAVKKAIAAGVTLVAASGNDGSGRVSYPAALSDVIAVGAVDPELNRAEFSQFGPELAIVAPGVAVVSSVPQGSGRAPYMGLNFGAGEESVLTTSFVGAREPNGSEINDLVYAGLGKVEDFKNINVKGKFALIARGEIRFSEKIDNAIKAGATGAVIYNNQPGLLNGALTDDGSVLPVAVFMIEQAVGERVASSLKANKTVKATLRIEATDYSAFDGTSMATPHVAGVVALMKAANKALTPQQVKEILKKTATALNGPNTKNELGSGLVNAEAAVNESIK